MTRVVVVMGVSGAGKTTVGQALAGELDASFFDADDYHPAANVTKMAAGQPLDDTDRQPWLARLGELIEAQLIRGETAVLACSALKQSYRDRLRRAGVVFVYLRGSYATIRQRLAQRQHFMPKALLASQFAALEEPARAIVVDVDQPVAAIVDQIVAALS